MKSVCSPFASRYIRYIDIFHGSIQWTHPNPSQWFLIPSLKQSAKGNFMFQSWTCRGYVSFRVDISMVDVSGGSWTMLTWWSVAIGALIFTQQLVKALYNLGKSQQPHPKLWCGKRILPEKVLIISGLGMILYYLPRLIHTIWTDSKYLYLFTSTQRDGVCLLFERVYRGLYYPVI